ncbi:hypothetical protein FNL56_13260 [Tardiphaga sp. vice304]|uniref:hypothetical protein n=1 Tax=Tardiphaga sp. vice304 TaxID=2592817 RepID=UPI0011655A58|nr:hypothetical protein [Tardiphaga sp. vice304]QDM26969.1 hypothetical protein FNL56_13260 [Tardiphaga sp. vice304]
MTSQQQADQMLGAYQAACYATRHLPAAVRERVIDNAILLATNSNSAPSVALFDAQIAAVRGAIGAEELA